MPFIISGGTEKPFLCLRYSGKDEAPAFRHDGGIGRRESGCGLCGSLQASRASAPLGIARTGSVSGGEKESRE